MEAKDQCLIAARWMHNLSLTTYTYTGIMLYPTIVLNLPSMPYMITVDLKKWGGGLPQLASHKVDRARH